MDRPKILPCRQRGQSWWKIPARAEIFRLELIERLCIRPYLAKRCSSQIPWPASLFDAATGRPLLPAGDCPLSFGEALPPVASRGELSECESLEAETPTCTHHTETVRSISPLFSSNLRSIRIFLAAGGTNVKYLLA